MLGDAAHASTPHNGAGMYSGRHTRFEGAATNAEQEPDKQ